MHNVCMTLYINLQIETVLFTTAIGSLTQAMLAYFTQKIQILHRLHGGKHSIAFAVEFSKSTGR